MFFFFNGFMPMIFVFFLIIFIVGAANGRRRHDYYGDRHYHRGGHNQPRLTVDAIVVDKFVESSYNGRCCVVFEVESKDRLSFAVSPEEHRLLVVGDRGRLSFQGDYYYGFTRSQ